MAAATAPTTSTTRKTARCWTRTASTSFVTYIAALALGDYYTYDAAEADLAETGLDEPELTVTIDYPESGEEDAETLTFTISFSRSAADKLTDWDEVLAALEAEEEASDARGERRSPRTLTPSPTCAWARAPSSTRSSYDTFKALMACSYDDLRHTEIFPAEVEDVTALSVTLDGGTYEFTTTPPEGARRRRTRGRSGTMKAKRRTSRTSAARSRRSQPAGLTAAGPPARRR